MEPVIRVAADVIIERPGGIVLIERRNPPPGWALPGGFVEYGETVDQAARREAREETGLDLAGLVQFHVYSDPTRDPRGHVISVVFIACGRGELRAGDDARRAAVYALDRLPALVFDHARILADYRAVRRSPVDSA